MNSTEVACGPGFPHQNLLLICKPYWGWADLQSTIALQANNYWFGGQTTIAVALTLYRFVHALWWLFLTIA